jgi:hypothetical protein
MKKVHIFSLFCLIAFFSCNKYEDLYDDLGKGAYLTLVRQNNGLLNASDPNSTVGQVVSSYGDPVESVNLYVSSKQSGSCSRVYHSTGKLLFLLRTEK